MMCGILWLAFGTYPHAPNGCADGRQHADVDDLLGAFIGYHLGKKKHHGPHKAFRGNASGWAAMRQAKRQIRQAVAAGLAPLDSDSSDSDGAPNISLLREKSTPPFGDDWAEFKAWKRQQDHTRQVPVSRPAPAQYIPEAIRINIVEGADKALEAMVQQINGLKQVSLIYSSYCRGGQS